MEKNIITNSSSGGIGFVGLLTITFIVLKLVGVIDWNWWWILSPIWIAAIITVSILIFVLLIILIIALATK